MKYTTASALAATAAIFMASPIGAAPTKAGIQDGEAFTVTIIGSLVEHSKFQAANNGIYVDTPKQNSSCLDMNYALFTIRDGSLFLWADDPVQQIAVDLSGMGQGHIRYTTGNQSLGRNEQRGPFGFDDEGSLKLLGQGHGLDTGFLSCPNAYPAGSSIWLANSGNPGGNTGCVPVSARPTKVDNPVYCEYSQYKA